MICPNCGADQPVGARFCNQCGTKLHELAPATVELRCANCGYENPSGSKFCGECGVKLATTIVQPESVGTLTLFSVSMRFISASGTVIHFPQSSTGTWTIGREDPVNNIHPDIDLTPYDPEQSVSRRHAQIRLVGGQPSLISIAQTNGSKLNDVQLTPHEAVYLHSGDRIEFARCKVTFECDTT